MHAINRTFPFQKEENKIKGKNKTKQKRTRKERGDLSFISNKKRIDKKQENFLYFKERKIKNLQKYENTN